MRTIWVLFLAIVLLLFGYIALGIFWIVGKFNPHKADLLHQSFAMAIFRAVLKFTGAKLTVIGKENVPKDEAVLYVANHRGIFDVLLSYPECPGLTGYISKDSIDKVPAVRLWMRRLHCLFLDRDDIKQGLKVILTAIDYVKQGISIFVFPEGTRNKNQEDSADVAPFKDGTFKIAQKTGCKVIPVAITGTAEILENQFPWMRRGPVIIQYGTPITLEELSPEDRKHPGEYFRKAVATMLESHKSL